MGQTGVLSVGKPFLSWRKDLLDCTIHVTRIRRVT